MQFGRVVLLSLLIAPALVCAEVPPQKTLPCFPGAYYRKAVSSQDLWTGIEGVVTLPSFDPDTSRTNPKNGRYMDNPSVYMGGNSGDQEIDAGVSWEVIKYPDGKVSPMGKAYRPFWRNKDWSSGPAKPDFYYYPGDKIRMRIETVQEGKLQMSIELLERSEVGKKMDAEVRAAGAKDEGSTAPETANLTTLSPDAATSLTVNFDARNFGPGKVQEFKRVNAIDQSGNEGKGVSPTRATVKDATWHEVWLLRGKERLPMSPSRFTDMRCPEKHLISAYNFGESGERISIRGKKP